MLDDIKKFIGEKIQIPQKIINEKIREKAISNTKIMLMEKGMTMDEAIAKVGSDGVEVFISEEEQKLKNKIKDMSWTALVAYLGLEAFGSI